MQSQTLKGTRRLWRTVPILFLAAALLALVLVSMGALSTSTAHAQELKDADIIVQFDDSDVAIRSIQFTNKISGFAALEMSGFEMVSTDTQFGPFVCSIEGIGCPASECPCFGLGSWGYNYWDGNDWAGYLVGAGGSVISETGSIEGWRWGTFGDPMIPVTGTLAAQDGLKWLRDAQESDGGFGSMGASAEAAFAIGANKEKAADWQTGPGMPTVADYTFANLAKFVDNSVAASGKSIMAVAATDSCWPIGMLRPADYYTPTLGTYSEHMGFHLWGVFGAMAEENEISASSIAFIKNGPQPNGGWEWMAGFGTDTNTTSIAIQALVAAGESVTSTEVISGLQFIKSAQNENGGFSYDPDSTFGTDSDTNSTAYVVQAIWAAGQDPNDSKWMSSASRSPIDYLLDMQLSDGSFEWMPGIGSDPLATMQAVVALLGNPNPLSIGIDVCPAIYLPQMVAE